MGEAPVDSWDHQANKALMFSEDKKDKELIATLALLCQSLSGHLEPRVRKPENMTKNRGTVTLETLRG